MLVLLIHMCSMNHLIGMQAPSKNCLPCLIQLAMSLCQRKMTVLEQRLLLVSHRYSMNLLGFGMRCWVFGF